MAKHKNKIYLLLFCLLIFLILPKFVGAFSNESDILIRYKSDDALENVENNYFTKPNQVEKIKEINVVKIKDPTIWQKIKIYYDKNIKNEIEYSEPDYTYSTYVTPNDPQFYNQWALNKISAQNAWDITTGNDIIVAIVDSGINGTHPDLVGKIINGYNTISNVSIGVNTNSDDYGHGTTVAGITSAASNNNQGISGVNWQARLMPVKVINSSGLGYSSDVAEGIIYAADHGAKIINLSLGGPSFSDTLKNAIDYAVDVKKVLVIAASGNSNTSVSYPAKYEKVIAVGASDQSDYRWYKSNYGPELDVIAPGTSTLTTTRDGNYSYPTGTSYSAPHVSGLAALIWSTNNSYSNQDVEEIIKNSADKVSAMEGRNYTQYYGYGRINADKSVRSGSEYQAVIIGQNSSPQVAPGEYYNFYVKLKNTGTKTWQKQYIKLGTENVPVFELSAPDGENNSWVNNTRVEMIEDSVSQGQMATFSFWMKAPENIAAGTYQQRFKLVDENNTWFLDPEINWDINVKSKAELYFPVKWESQNAYPQITQGESYDFYLKIKNTGSATWEKDKVYLGTNNPENRTPVFERISGWYSQNRVEMQESTVAPGETATFSFTMKAPDNLGPGTYREYFRLVAENITWMQDWGIYWDVNVKSRAELYYPAKWDSQNAYPVLSQGESYNFYLKMKNNGSANWEKDKVFLGTSNPRDRAPVFEKESGWFSDNRVEMQESSIAPGETATFSFTMKAPDNLGPGTYREYFCPVAENVTWMQDWGVYWDVSIRSPHSRWVNQSSYPHIKAGEKTNIWVEFKNIGQTTWFKDSSGPIRLGTSNPQDRISIFKGNNWFSQNRINMNKDSVAPGETVRFEFEISAPSDINPGIYREYFRPVADTMLWMEDNGVYFDIIVDN